MVLTLPSLSRFLRFDQKVTESEDRVYSRLGLKDRHFRIILDRFLHIPGITRSDTFCQPRLKTGLNLSIMSGN